MLGCHHVDIRGIANGPPDSFLSVLVLEPTVVGVVPPKVRRDRRRHDGDVAGTSNVPSAGEEPGHIAIFGRVRSKTSEMLRLLVTCWDVADRRLSRLGAGTRRCPPRNMATRRGRPIVECGKCDHAPYLHLSAADGFSAPKMGNPSGPSQYFAQASIRPQQL